ncbi:MAG: DnaJ domain-containing protein [Bacteroidetes bacterium]|nr:DnaJ domain-containing protein [Bacteroidota bacterium]
MKDYYKILGVEKSDPDNAIKKRYRKLAKSLHPDINRSPDSDRLFALINEAYATLSDPDERKKYDLRLQRFSQPPMQTDYARQYHQRKNYNRRSDSYYRFIRFVKKEKKVTLLDKILFTTVLFIGVLLVTFSVVDLLSDQWDVMIRGLSGLLAGIAFLLILIYGWMLYVRR